jgi:hypothetical protein
LPGVLLAVAAALAGCRRRDVYPPDVVENFMRACQGRSPERVCRCALDAVQHRFTLAEFRALEQRAATGETPKELVDAVADCRP